MLLSLKRKMHTHINKQSCVSSFNVILVILKVASEFVVRDADMVLAFVAFRRALGQTRGGQQGGGGRGGERSGSPVCSFVTERFYSAVWDRDRSEQACSTEERMERGVKAKVSHFIC